MPANRVIETLYVVNSPETMNASSLYKPGELGGHYIDTQSREFQLVQLDSGATASTSVGVVAATQLAFWKNRTSYLVTNDINQAEGDPTIASYGAKRNAVAGVFMLAVTAGNYCLIQERGQGTVLAASGGTYGAGQQLIANSGNAADVTSSTLGTAPTQKLVGYANGSRSGTGVAVDLDLPWVP